LNTATLLWSLLFGSVGMGYFIYGKKQGSMVPMATGVSLMVFPYFVSQTLALVAIGAAFMAAPFFLKR